ncbi:hypothetical protein AAVH_11065 [Aphelenchoides avenae]|nr:hypothetical protein AAVH_11065 [Aphelenchus avenae]
MTEDFEIVLEDFESPLRSEPDCMDDWESDDGSKAVSCAATLTTAATVHDTGIAELPEGPDDEVEFLGVTQSARSHRWQWPDVDIVGMAPGTPSVSQEVTAGPNEATVQRGPAESAPISVPLTPPPLSATFRRAGRNDTPSRRSSAYGALEPPEQRATLRQARKSKLLATSATKPPVGDVLGVNYTFEQLDVLCGTVNGELVETRVYQCKTCVEAAKRYGVLVDLPCVKTVNGYFVDVDPGRPKGNTHLCTRNFYS